MKKNQTINVGNQTKVERSENVQIKAGDDNSTNSNPRTDKIWLLFIVSIVIVAVFLLAQRLGC